MGETCIYDDQDVINEKEHRGRCNELVKKNQSSMLQVSDAKSSVGTYGLETGRQHHWIRGRIHHKWGRLVASPILDRIVWMDHGVRRRTSQVIRPKDKRVMVQNVVKGIR